MKLQYTRAEKIIGGFAAVNFWTFMAASLWLGGSALSGKAIDGHYFLSSHGTLTEVSHGVYVYSYIHSICFWTMWPFIFWVGRRAQARNKAQISN